MTTQDNKQLLNQIEMAAIPWQDDDIIGVAKEFGFQDLGHQGGRQVMSSRGVGMGRARRGRICGGA